MTFQKVIILLHNSMRTSSPSIPCLPPLSELGKSLLAAFASPFSQKNRLFKMRFSEGSRIAPELLLPYHLRGVEQISGTYLYQVEALSPSVRLRPKQFNGQPVLLSLLADDGDERVITGVVTAFGQIGSTMAGLLSIPCTSSPSSPCWRTPITPPCART